MNGNLRVNMNDMNENINWGFNDLDYLSNDPRFD